MVHVVDQGARFTPETAAAPFYPRTSPGPINHGILFMRMIMDKLHFLLSFGDSTEVRMVKKLA